MKNLYLASLVLTILASSTAGAADKKSTPGLLPEIKLQGDTPEADDKRSLETELMIRRSERLAIKKLQGILQTRKGQPDEPHLLYRLGELYMRRAKTGRFFDVNRGNKVLELAPPEAKTEDAKKSINAAIMVYNRIQTKFPKYSEMDEIYFHNAFAHQQLKRNNVARVLYTDLLKRFPNSPFAGDSHIALGEMFYEAQNFNTAWSHFAEVQKNPKSKLYSYALYKGAWTLYNLHQSDQAITSLEKLVLLSDADQKKQLHNLRTEALRDLVVFYADNRDPKMAYDYFVRLAKPEEIGQVVTALANLYQSHSREKDSIAILRKFDSDHTTHPDRPRVNLQLVDLHEALKERPEALEQMAALQSICRPEGSWSKSQPQGHQDEVCLEKMGQSTLRLASKWWDTWKKNAHAVQFADWSEKAFSLYLTPAKPENEAKIRFTYADLLFQRNKFAEASFEYEKAARLEKTGDIAVNAAYAALVALEKSVSDKWEENSEKRLYSLSKFYLDNFPKSEQYEQVQFKLGYVSYVRGRLSESKGYLKTLAETAKDQAIRIKAEDLYLDVLNVEKDYTGLRAWATAAAGRTTDAPRKSRLEEISREARMAEIEILAKDNPIKAAQSYEDFYRGNRSHKLAKSAFLNAIRLNNAGGDLLAAATLALEFSKDYPTDKDTNTLLQEAARLFEQTARPLEAAKTLELLAKNSDDAQKRNWQEIAADYYSIENEKDRAITLYFELAEAAPTDKKAAIYSKIYHLAKEGSAAHSKAEKQLVALRVEPFWSELMLAEAKRLYSQKNFPAAFQQAMKILGQSSDTHVKSQARLIQADILRNEFQSQSVKTSLDRLTMVLSLKTEKLEKAQRAYMSAQSMAAEPAVQLKALEGLKEIYASYVIDIKEMPAPRGLASASDEQMLRSELTALTDPIETKSKEIDEEIKAVQSRMFASTGSETNLNGLSASQSLTPLTYQETYHLQAYVPFTGGEK